MKPLRNLAVLTLLAPMAAGCASRTAPFDELDKAPMTVLRLQGQEAPPPPPVQAQGMPLIPGLPPELQQMGEQALQGLQQVLPPGMIPPGFLPGQPQMQPAQPPAPRFKGFVILGHSQVSDETVREELLDIFGDESSFRAERGNCFYPGMGISIARQNAAPVELLVSLSCSQAMGDGFQWPYKTNGFTPESHQRLTRVFERLWGPVPPGA